METILSKRLKELRTEMGISQVALAEKLDLNPVTYLRYEKGQREPSLALVCDFAKFFGVSTDYLLGLTDY